MPFQISNIDLDRALALLINAMNCDVIDDLRRDGAIQRFKYCTELSWRTLKKHLERNGISSDAPRDVFRKAANLNWIDDATIWFDFLDVKNKTIYMYEETIALEVFALIPPFIIEAEMLIKKLKSFE